MGRGSGQGQSNAVRHEAESSEFNEKRTWFVHVCHHCGHKSKELDFIVGDGIYQCWFSNRAQCEARHGQLAPEEWIALPKPHHMEHYSKIQLMLLALGKDPLASGTDWIDAASRVHGVGPYQR